MPPFFEELSEEQRNRVSDPSNVGARKIQLLSYNCDFSSVTGPGALRDIIATWQGNLSGGDPMKEATPVGVLSYPCSSRYSDPQSGATTSQAGP